MNNPFFNNEHIAVVSTFSELINTDFQAVMNAICWERDLDGDFEEIVSQLQLKENITEVSTEDLLKLNLSKEGRRMQKMDCSISMR